MIKAWKQLHSKAQERALTKRGFRKAGYSLMEILIVLAIIGLLVALVGPELMKTFGGAQTKSATAQVKTIKEALNQMNIDIGRYPTDAEGLGLLTQALDGDVANWNGPYLSGGVPLDPWKKPYVYKLSETGEPIIVSLGKDGKEGGTGADADIAG